MILSDLITPERVREIAEQVIRNRHGAEAFNIKSAIIVAAPEIARAALEMAAKRLEERDPFHLVTHSAIAERLRQLAKELGDA